MSRGLREAWEVVGFEKVGIRFFRRRETGVLLYAVLRDERTWGREHA